MQLKNLDFLLEKCKSAPRMTLAVACPQGDDILEAVVDAAREGVVDPVLVGNRSRSEAIAEELGLDLSGIAFVDEPNDALAAEKAVKMVSSGEAHLLMKGNVKTAVLLKAVLNKEWGLRSGSLLSHLFLFQVPRMPGVIGMSDGGMTMYPDLPTKVGIVENAVWAYHRIGVECPKIAALAAVEVVNPDMQATLDAAALAQMNRRGQIKGCLIDGPLALDNAVSAEAARIKGNAQTAAKLSSLYRAVAIIPEEPALERAWESGRTPAKTMPRSPFVKAVGELLDRLFPASPAAGKGRKTG